MLQGYSIKPQTQQQEQQYKHLQQMQQIQFTPSEGGVRTTFSKFRKQTASQRPSEMGPERQ